jgi:hypothetical protein
MLKKAAWLAFKIEARLFSILVAAAILTNVFFNPGPHSESLILVYVPLAFQFAGAAVALLAFAGSYSRGVGGPAGFSGVIPYLFRDRLYHLRMASQSIDRISSAPSYLDLAGCPGRVGLSGLPFAFTGNSARDPPPVYRTSFSLPASPSFRISMI